MFMISEEYIRREKLIAEVYERYYDSRPELKEESEKLYNLYNNDKISFEEYRKKSLELGKKYD